MNKLFLTLIALLIFANLFANELYFVVGHPRKDLMNQYPVTLVKYLNEDSCKLTQIVSSELAVKAIQTYNKEGIALITAQNMVSGNNYLYVISIGNPCIVNKFDVTEKGYSLIRVYYIRKNNVPVCMLDYFGWQQTDKQKYEGLDLINYSAIKCDENNLVQIIVTGSPGGAVGGNDQSELVVDENDDLLIPEIHSRPAIGIKQPKSNPFTINDIISLNINNDNFMMISSQRLCIKNEYGRIHTDAWIYEKESKEWDKLNIPGIPTFYRGFGNWMAGTVTERTKGRNNSKVTVEKKELPGKEKRDQKLRKTGTPVDYRYNSFEIYSDGQLFLFNVETKKKITINTGQGDSEVLLIEGDILYYRVYDSIYQATIKNGEVENGQMILQDEYVPDIHWAFISKP